MSDLLDTHDLISGNYVLEVSSPGLNRALKSERDFQRAQGQIVRLVVRGQGEVIGTLLWAGPDELDVKTEEDRVKVSRAEVTRANLYFEF
jgi:ribosome maturation factor RimP